MRTAAANRQQAGEQTKAMTYEERMRILANFMIDHLLENKKVQLKSFENKSMLEIRNVDYGTPKI